MKRHRKFLCSLLVITASACGDGIDDAWERAEVGAAATLENLALSRGKITNQSGFQPGNPPEHLIDGVTGTDDNRWSVSGLPTAQWAEIDLGAEYVLTTLRLDSFQNRDYQFRVDVRTANTPYGTAVSMTANALPGPISGSFPAGTRARFVKLIVAGARTYSGTWVSIREFEVFGSTIDAPPGAGPERNVVSASASSDDGNVPANTLDGDLSTRWSALGSGQWIQLDLGQDSNVGQLGVAWFRGDLRRASFSVSLAANGSTFTEVFRGSSSGTSLKLELATFPARWARYVRIVGYGSTESAWNSIVEARVYGPLSGPSPTPSPTAAGRHPGGLNTPSQIATTAQKIAQGAQPWAAAWARLQSVANGRLGEQPSAPATYGPIPEFYVDRSGNIAAKSIMQNDMFAAYSSAVVYAINAARTGTHPANDQVCWGRARLRGGHGHEPSPSSGSANPH